eukprot:715038-Pelagomonas_calceolata.AAC.1
MNIKTVPNDASKLMQYLRKLALLFELGHQWRQQQQQVHNNNGALLEDLRRAYEARLSSTPLLHGAHPPKALLLLIADGSCNAGEVVEQ